VTGGLGRVRVAGRLKTEGLFGPDALDHAENGPGQVDDKLRRVGFGGREEQGRLLEQLADLAGDFRILFQQLLDHRTVGVTADFDQATAAMQPEHNWRVHCNRGVGDQTWHELIPQLFLEPVHVLPDRFQTSDLRVALVPRVVQRGSGWAGGLMRFGATLTAQPAWAAEQGEERRALAQQVQSPTGHGASRGSDQRQQLRSVNHLGGPLVGKVMFGVAR
jgi:hypothetical protein